VFGTARIDLVTLAVTVILFEGGLALRVEDLRQQQRSLTRLLTLGALISMLVGTCAAHYVLGMPWPIASLYGALMIVTGPTVVTPLLTRLTIDRTVRELLISEGVLIDPIGAIVAIVAAEYVLGRSPMWQTGWLLFARLGIGGVIGGAAGLALAFVLRREWIPDYLRNPTVLGVVLLSAALASRLSSEAGLMAAVTQGVVMANTGLREMGRLRQFKEELTVLLLSFIFVLLAAGLPFGAVQAIGWRALLVVALLAWVARPIAVFLCTIGSGLSLPQRLFVSWICPRGIIAASVAGLFSILLSDARIAGGDQLEAMVFITVGLTVTVQGLTASPVSRLLGVDLPTLQGMMIIGADYFGRLLGRVLAAQGRQVVLVDINPQHCRIAQSEGLLAYNGDALVVDSLEEAGARYADTVLAATTNQELNTLIGQRVRDNFRVERVLAVSDPLTSDSDKMPFPGEFPGLDEINRLLLIGRGRLVQYEVVVEEWYGRRLNELTYGPGEFALLLERRDQVYIATGGQPLAQGDRVLCFQASDEASPLAELFPVVRAANASEAPEFEMPTQE
jgi:NhaP-type Na+/H+ or K+/H+ antiporter